LGAEYETELTYATKVQRNMWQTLVVTSSFRPRLESGSFRIESKSMTHTVVTFSNRVSNPEDHRMKFYCHENHTVLSV